MDKHNTVSLIQIYVYSTECTVGEVIFVFDESPTVSDVEFDAQVAFALTLIDESTIDTSNTQVSALSFSWEAVNRFFLNEHSTNADVNSALGKYTRQVL